MLWAKPGLDKFQQQLNKLKQKPRERASELGLPGKEPRSDVHKEGIQKGWFREEKDPQEMSTSLAEIGDSTCESTLQNMKNNKKHCAEQTWRNVLNTCLQEKNTAPPEKHQWDTCKGRGFSEILQTGRASDGTFPAIPPLKVISPTRENLPMLPSCL